MASPTATASPSTSRRASRISPLDVGEASSVQSSETMKRQRERSTSPILAPLPRIEEDKNASVPSSSKQAMEAPSMRPDGERRDSAVLGAEAESDDDGQGARKKRMQVSFLPSDIEASIRSALINSRASSMSSVPAPSRKPSVNRSPSRGFLQHMERFRQQRAMSVPENARNGTHVPRATLPPETLEESRRGSLRAQQLALLASQARLASIGTTSVGTARRTESAVKAAVYNHAEDARLRHRHSETPALLAIREGKTNEEAEGSDSDGDAEDTDAPANAIPSLGNRSMSMTPDESVAAWSAAMSSPSDTSSFMESASEVARSWATGFYAFEKEWVGDALERERRRSSAVGPTEVAARASAPPNLQQPSPVEESEDESGSTQERPSLLRPHTVAAPAQDWSTLVPRSMAPLLAAQKRLSDASQEARASLESLAGRSASVSDTPVPQVTAPGGRLVDVLNNFASLLETRTEGCQGLERLAQDAQRLAATSMPTLRRESRCAAASSEADAAQIPSVARESALSGSLSDSPASSA